jgi:hypothetical protein
VALHRRVATLNALAEVDGGRLAPGAPTKKIVTPVLHFFFQFCKYCARD